MGSSSPVAAALEALIRQVVREELAAHAAPAQPQRQAEVEFLTVSGAAAVAKVHPSTVRGWLRDGRLRRYAAGKRARVKAAEMQALLEGQPSAEPINLAERAAEIRARLEKKAG